MDSQRPTREGPVSPSVTISNSIVRLYRTHFGRGPTKTRVILQGDLVAVLLEDVLTTAERTLVESGHSQQVSTQRTLLQYALADQFASAVEEATGRTVRMFVSGVNAEASSASELFALEPEPGDDDSSRFDGGPRNG
jgi:uncharacterized protein YbcI